jgi:hypothetical protein
MPLFHVEFDSIGPVSDRHQANFIPSRAKSCAFESSRCNCPPLISLRSNGIGSWRLRLDGEPGVRGPGVGGERTLRVRNKNNPPVGMLARDFLLGAFGKASGFGR